ncbi:hypothetical protein ACTFQF_14130 [Aliivibrio fischeri]|uniref:hypothetical protein n=1 Tax=Aliivibrio fischeri TaxID=668 RepID=UPI003F7756A9
MIKLFLHLALLISTSCGAMYFLWVSSYHLFFDETVTSIVSFRYAILGIIGAQIWLGLASVTAYQHIVRWYKYQEFKHNKHKTILEKKAILFGCIIGLAPYFINNYYIEKYDLIKCESDLFIDCDDFYFARYVSSIEQCPIKLEANKK